MVCDAALPCDAALGSLIPFSVSQDLQRAVTSPERSPKVGETRHRLPKFMDESGRFANSSGEIG
jgi:hypothetical protein